MVGVLGAVLAERAVETNERIMNMAYALADAARVELATRAATTRTLSGYGCRHCGGERERSPDSDRWNDCLTPNCAGNEWRAKK